MDTQPAGRVVFSQLYNESDAFLRPCIEGFLAQTGPEAVLVLNLPMGRVVDPAMHGISSRVFLINGKVQRHPFGHTLLGGHLECFAFARERLGVFGHFCTLASNSLLVRRFDLAATLASLAESRHEAPFDIEALPEFWHWAKMRQTPELLAALRRDWGITRCIGQQIEGLFATRKDWEELAARTDDVARFGAAMRPELPLPLEEILPGTCFTHFGSGHFTWICHVFWDRLGPAQSMNGNVGPADVLGMAERFPPHICALKWFERSPAAVETAAVLQPWSRLALGELAEAVATGDADRLFIQRGVLERLADAVRQRQGFAPYCAVPGWAAEGVLARFSAEGLRAEGQRIALEGVPDGAAFLKMEHGAQALDLTLELAQEGAATRLSLRGRSLGGEASGPAGFLYLAPLRPGRAWSLRLRLPQAAIAEAERVPQALRFSGDAGAFGAWSRIRYQFDTAAEREYYFRQEAWSAAEAGWFGIPVFGDMALDLLLDAPA
ncbi:hypothetical protein [Belnapia rosea]|uniref:hypothetical protein n=1 Tax=Belnapia rosea TaxID=938405 RepID=UPI000880D953|nr:hypothetical protein [Belnapia rosea]SDB49621.1 hypothetical protein SAMN02927895_01911 [Belnapia rosea]